MPRKVVTLHLKRCTSKWLPGAGEREGQGVTANGCVVPLGFEENVLELYCDNGCTTL